MAATGSDRPEARIDALVAKQSAALTDLTSALLRLPTFEPEHCAGAISVVADALAGAGFDVEEHHPADERGACLPLVIGWLGPRTDRPDLLLCAHIDTSPPGEGWTRDPFGAGREGGFLFGRGAAVSKSDAACFIHAASAAWKALNGGKGRTVAVAVTSDEGSGGDHGAGWLLKTAGIRPRCAIFPGSTDVVTVAHNGCVQVRVRIVGTACHQSLLPLAEDAMRAATRLCAEVYALADRLGGGETDQPLRPTLNITRVTGGTVFGMAPRAVEIWIDRRVTPDEDLTEARDQLVSLIGRVLGTGSVSSKHEIVREAEPMRSDPAQQPFVTLLREEVGAAFGKDAEVFHSTLYTDARWYSNAGIPTVMYGVGEADIRASGANGADERVPEIFLTRATTILARAIARFLSEKH